MTKRISTTILVVILLALTLQGVSAQAEEPYSVTLRRDFGYGNGAEIQGRMTLSLKGDETQVKQVVFLLDETTLATLTVPPYNFSFNTDSYPAGNHKLSAQIQTKDGQTFTTRAIGYRFLSKNEANKSLVKVILPVGIIVIVALLGSTLGQTLFTRKGTPATNRPADYGMLGGAVCSRCGKPFPRSVFGMNLVVGKLERCPHCGKWGITRRANPLELAEAEEKLAKEFQQPTTAENPDNKNKEILDDTRYTDKL